MLFPNGHFTIQRHVYRYKQRILKTILTTSSRLQVKIKKEKWEMAEGGGGLLCTFLSKLITPCTAGRHSEEDGPETEIPQQQQRGNTGGISYGNIFLSDMSSWTTLT